MNKTKKNLLNFVLAPFLLLVLLFFIYRQIEQKGSLASEWFEFQQHLQRSSPTVFSAILLLSPLNWMMEALKWRVLVRKIEPMSFGKAFASTLTGISFSLITPNKIGDFVGRILYLENRSKLRGAIATFVGNIAQTSAAFFFGLVGILYLNIAHPGVWQLFALSAAVCGLAAFLFLYFRMDLLTRWSASYPKLRKLKVALLVLKRYSKRDLRLILLLSLMRFCVYTSQFLILIYFFGVSIPWVQGFLLSGTFFWMITVVPSFFVADVGVRGFVASLLFISTGVAENTLSVLAGTYAIWILNLVVPALIGSLLLLFVRVVR